MPHESRPPPGTRFFARLDQFHCECPACGAIIVAHKDGTRGATHSAFKRRRATQYNPLASRLTCPACRRVFGVGLLLWPLTRASRSAAIPADHQPTRRQLAQLRQYSYGIWTAEIKRQGDALNVALEVECTCPQDEGSWRPSCTVHGYEAFTARQAALPDLPRPLIPGEPGYDDTPHPPDCRCDRCLCGGCGHPQHEGPCRRSR